MNTRKEYHHAYNKENREKIAARVRAKRAVLRQEIITRLGGRCAKCGFDDARALQIDHINGDGAGHRRKTAYITYYGNILDEICSGSDRFQLLCANCNWIKRAENGEWH